MPDHPDHGGEVDQALLIGLNRSAGRAAVLSCGQHRTMILAWLKDPLAPVRFTLLLFPRPRGPALPARHPRVAPLTPQTSRGHVNPLSRHRDQDRDRDVFQLQRARRFPPSLLPRPCLARCRLPLAPLASGPVMARLARTFVSPVGPALTRGGMPVKHSVDSASPWMSLRKHFFRNLGMTK